MKIEAHLLHWQEKDIMPFVIKHYQKFCDEIIIHDNHSKDGSAELAKELGCTVIPFGSDFFDDKANMDLKNNCWKGSDANWVVVADFDEVLCDHDTIEFEGEARIFRNPFFSDYVVPSVTIFKTIGWQIMSDFMPDEDILDITHGFEFSNYAKSIIFNPKAITEINYGPGAHECNPVGVVNWSTEPLYVLHYKHVGGLQRTIDRYRVLNKRLSNNNRRNGWGIHYSQSPGKLRNEWNERMLKSRPLI